MVDVDFPRDKGTTTSFMLLISPIKHQFEFFRIFIADKWSQMESTIKICLDKLSVFWILFS